MQDTKQQTSGAKTTDQGNADTSRELKRRKLNGDPSSQRQQVRAYKGASEDENDATLSSDVDAETSSSDSGQDQSTVGEENDGESSHLVSHHSRTRITCAINALLNLDLARSGSFQRRSSSRSSHHFFRRPSKSSGVPRQAQEPRHQAATYRRGTTEKHLSRRHRRRSP